VLSTLFTPVGLNPFSCDVFCCQLCHAGTAAAPLMWPGKKWVKLVGREGCKTMREWIGTQYCGWVLACRLGARGAAELHSGCPKQLHSCVGGNLQKGACRTVVAWSRQHGAGSLLSTTAHQQLCSMWPTISSLKATAPVVA
jgi:hypothetical protein